MLFRFIGIFSALACAATSFAAPVSQPIESSTDLADVIAGITKGGNIIPSVGVPTLPSTGVLGRGVGSNVLPEALNSILGRKEQHPTLPEIFKNAHTKLGPIADKIRAKLKTGSAAGKADVDVIVGLLVQIVAVLSTILSDLQYIVKNPVGAVLSLQGVTIGLKEVSLLVTTLLNIVVTVLALVLRLLDVALHGKVLPIIAQIGALLVQIIALVLRLVPALLGNIISILLPILGDLKLLRWNDLISKLRLL